MSDALATRSSVPSTVAKAQLDFVILDGSTSMMSKWWDMLKAIDTYVDGLKAGNMNSHITISTFDSLDLEMIQRDQDLDTWTSLDKDPIGANWGSTPLYDAINVNIRRIREIDPAKCHILIVTDGEENHSQFTNLTQAKAILDWARAKGWQVTFIGCDFNNSAQAQLLGADKSSAIGVQTKLLSEATKNLAKKRVNYGLYGGSINWSESEQQQFGGYLNAPDAK